MVRLLIVGIDHVSGLSLLGRGGKERKERLRERHFQTPRWLLFRIAFPVIDGEKSRRCVR